MNDWIMRTLDEAVCRDCGGGNLKSIEDRFPVREVDVSDGYSQKFSPRECEDCHARFDVITHRGPGQEEGIVIAWSGPDVEFLDTPPVYMTTKEAWDKGIRHGMKNPYEQIPPQI